MIALIMIIAITDAATNLIAEITLNQLTPWTDSKLTSPRIKLTSRKRKKRERERKRKKFSYSSSPLFICYSFIAIIIYGQRTFCFCFCFSLGFIFLFQRDEVEDMEEWDTFSLGHLSIVLSSPSSALCIDEDLQMHNYTISTPPFYPFEHLVQHPASSRKTIFFIILVREYFQGQIVAI